MDFEKDIFKKRKIVLQTLPSYGFEKIDNDYIYKTKILNDTFLVKILINASGLISGHIYDLAFNEEYINYRIESQTGKFVSEVRKAFINILEDICANCTISVNFKSPQANRLTKLIKELYGDDPELPFAKDDYSAIFRNQNTQKWYGLIMNINKSKITKGKEDVDILNIKLNPEKIEHLLTHKGFYKAYHMNKVHWLTIILDDTLTDEEIMGYLKESYEYTVKKK